MMGIRRLTATGPGGSLCFRGPVVYFAYLAASCFLAQRTAAQESRNRVTSGHRAVALSQPGRPILFALHKNLLLMEIRRLSPLYRIFQEEKGAGYCQNWQQRPTVPAGCLPARTPERRKTPPAFEGRRYLYIIIYSPAPTPPRTDKSTGRRRCPRSGRRPPPNRRRGRRRGSRRRGRGGAPPGPG